MDAALSITGTKPKLVGNGMFCSYIIPTIGRPSLERAVRSVLEQDFHAADFEVIVVNASGRACSGSIFLRGEGPAELWDPASGKIMTAEAGAEGGFEISLPPYGAAFLSFANVREPRPAAKAVLDGLIEAVPLAEGAKARPEFFLGTGRWLPDASHLQRHVDAAIVYNAWQYYQATPDVEFLRFYAAEMILEIARFWASAATYNHSLDRYEIKGVMGPDEYHEAYPGAERPGLDNNAYTNVLAVWCILRAFDCLSLLPTSRERQLREKLRLTPEEIDRWGDITRKMRLCFHGSGILSQFEGYEDLEELDWSGYREQYGNIQRLDRILEAEGKSANQYKVAKQADTLMLFYLFSDGRRWSRRTRRESSTGT